jgi:hypothetical protein
MNALPFVSLVLAHPMFEPGKQLGEGVAERYVLRLVGEGPDVVDGLVKLVVVAWLRRFGCGEEHAKCGVHEIEAQAVEVVGDGALVARFGESVGAQVRTLTPSACARACSTDKRSIGCTSRSTCETQLSERFISLASSR